MKTTQFKGLEYLKHFIVLASATRVDTDHLAKAISAFISVRKEVNILRAENARLREALQPFAYAWGEMCGRNRFHILPAIKHVDLERAASALEVDHAEKN